MKLGMTGKEITKSKDGNWWYLFDEEGWKVAEEPRAISAVKEIYRTYKNHASTEEELKSVLDYNIQIVKSFEKTGDAETDAGSVSSEEYEAPTLGQVKGTIEDLMNFFSEFHFEPNFRFVNTFALACKRSKEEAQNYVKSYFELSDSVYSQSIVEKMKSLEFNQIMEDMIKINSKKAINQRFKLYYGSQGTGKTTVAMEESDGLVMVCHSAMLPQDLMEDFKFVDGNPEFQPSVLQNAIVEGKTIVLDEINLLPFESLRFLQSILDGKKEFTYKGKTIEVADGFKIIGTMNLVVNGSVYSLPEPLIDRAESLKKFALTSQNLVSALI